MKLREIQEAFGRSLEGQWPSPAARMINADGIGAEQRIEIYRNNILSSLTSALAETYPATCAAVGEAFFAQLAAKFTENHLPSEAPLHRYGKEFAGFFEREKSVAHLAWLPDLARLEWRLNASFYAADSEALDAQALEAVATQDPAMLSFVLAPHVKLLHSSHPVDAIRRFCLESASDTTLDISEEGEAFLLITRVHHAVGAERLEPGFYRLLSQLSAGLSLCEASRDCPPETLQSYLQECFTRRLFVRYSARAMAA